MSIMKRAPVMTQITESFEAFDNDEIAVTAVRDFCTMPRPGKTDATRLVDLVLPLLKSIGDESRREIAALLAVSNAAPKPLLLALCDYPVSISSPILTRCTLLTASELMAILSQRSPDHARAIARRTDLERPVVDALRMLENEGVDRALDLRQRLKSPLPREQEESFEQFRDELHGDVAAHAEPTIAMSIDELVSAARDPDPTVLHATVSNALAITRVSAAGLCGNPTSRNLIYMLRFVGASVEDGLKIFTALAPDLAGDPAVVARFEAVYGEIATEQAVHKVWTWRSDDLLALAREALSANDPGSPDEGRANIVHESIMKVA
mgnify:CR=1 FL=1